MVREKALGPDHPILPTASTALGFSSGPGSFCRREAAIRRALMIREKALGPDHPDTAESLNNLGLLLETRAILPRRGRSSSARSWSARRRSAPTIPTLREPQQPWACAWGPGRFCWRDADHPARAGDPREGARTGPSRDDREPQQPSSLMWTVPGWQAPFLGCGD